MAYKKPFWLALSFFIASLLYLIPVVIFNVQLADIARASEINSDALQQMELFGRAISGIGVTLLIADLLMKGKLVERRSYILLSLVVIAAISWPVTFFGQKILIDNVLVNSSSAEKRQEAIFARVMRSNFSDDMADLKKLTYFTEHSLMPTDKTFLSLLSGLLYTDDPLFKVGNNKQAIIEKYITDKGRNMFDRSYTDYRSMRDTIKADWKEYDLKVKEYDLAISAASIDADVYWKSIEQDMRDSWSSYLKYKEKTETRATKLAQQITPTLYKLWEARSNCYKREHDDSNRYQICIDSVVKQYKVAMKSYDIPYRDMEFWGNEQAMTDQSGDAYSVFTYTQDASVYQERILELLGADYTQTTGYELVINSYSEFYGYPQTAKDIIRKSSEEGIILPINWRVEHVLTFKKAVKKQVINNAKKAWKVEMGKHNSQLMPHLSWNEFLNHPDVQAKMKALMGENYYVNPMRVSWNDKEFYQHVIKPNIQKEHAYWLNYSEYDQSQFEDGADSAEEGKAALRAILVPPISISISLLLVLIILIKIPFSIWEFFGYYLDSNVTYRDTKEKDVKKSSNLIFVILLAVLPGVFAVSKYSNNDAGMLYFANKYEYLAAPLAPSLVKWAITAPSGKEKSDANGTNKLNLNVIFNPKIYQSLRDFENLVYARYPLAGNTDDSVLE